MYTLYICSAGFFIKTFERAKFDDIEKLINIRNMSFYEDYIKYIEYSGYTIIEEYMDGSVKLALFEKKMKTGK
ncbi:MULTISPECIES: hypothetical protein [unclassified Clostridium]|uniref:hypothetical protein n=1 Tax=unclassified Clostridium TaxID=2614128 RepID=UPI000297A165|nr:MULTISPECIES: hypothetical protein [unclassified Clostridium]EKQ56591.1 MAG: hypothetical protein A370_01661 [Clostridium sp. Maddingley MBC34-26]